MVSEISPVRLAELKQQGALQIVDVREDTEVALCRIPDAVHIPLRRLLEGGETLLDPAQETVCYCHHGVRSLHSAFYLLNRGFARVHSLAGGIHAWSLEVDPSVPTY